jgi:hypothetical protein
VLASRWFDHRAQATDCSRARSAARVACVLLMLARHEHHPLRRSFALARLGRLRCGELEYLANAPPDPKAEAKTPCPAPGHIWVAGYWDYIDGHHVWRDGRWVQGKIGYEYIRARYEFDGKAWQFHIPHWHRRAVTEPVQMAAAAQSRQ